VQRFAFHQDGRRLLSQAVAQRAARESTLGWDPRTGELDPILAGAMLEDPPSGFEPLPGLDNTGLSEFTTTSPDGKITAQFSRMSGYGTVGRSKDYELNSVTLREALSDRTIRILVGHTADVTGAAFSPDGRRLATASFDRTIKLWDVATGRDVFTLRGHTAGVVSVAFSPDGQRLVSGGIDATARVWDATPMPPETLAELDASFRQKQESLSHLTEKITDARQGDFLARRGQWGQACEAFGIAVEHEPSLTPLRRAHFLSLLKAGNVEGYRRAVSELASRSVREAVLRDPEWVPWFCVLAPGAVPDLDLPIRLAETVLPSYTAGMQHYVLNILGAALYRAGRYDEAVRRLEQSASDWSGVGAARNWVFLAMAHHRLGHREEARLWLEKLRAYAKRELATEFWEHVEIGILQSEAESLLSSAELPADPSYTPGPR
jgi:tetratricopeptide (TPR) repeat protein